MKRTRGLSTQLLLFLLLLLFLGLATIALGSVFVHQDSMRQLVGERDLRAVRTAAAALSDSSCQEESPHNRDVLRELQVSPQTAVFLVNRDGRIIVHTNPQQVGQVSTHPGVAEALAGQSGTLYRADEPGGPEHVVAYAPIPSCGWALLVDEPWAEVDNPLLRTSLAAPLILVPTVAAALLVIWFGVRRIVRPLQRLDAQVAAVGRGDFAAVGAPVGGIREVEDLQRALTRMAGEIRAYQQSLHEYLGAVTTAQEDERKRLARELHDDTVQNLIALQQRVQAARRKVGRDPAGLESQLAELQQMVETTTNEVRRFSRALRPLYLEEAGLVAALETLARDTSQDALKVSLEVIGDTRRLPPEIELALYRIAQEALTNVVRHARAKSAHVRLEFAGRDVAVRVQDDGVGFAVPERLSDLVGAGHYGLMGIQERAQLLGARFAVHSRPGEGVTIEVHLSTE
jgi:signal transduction histidine kinase